jgi:phosphoglycerol geranylgeranyltransferase
MLMKMGRVESYIQNIIDSGKGVFMGLIDPDKQDPEKGARLAKLMCEGGADLILIGGSTGVEGKSLEESARLIKESVSVPVHLFPGNVGNITKHADSLYFMSLLNSRNRYWITGAQKLGAPLISQHGIEAIPTAYLVFEPGQTVGEVGEADLLPRDNPEPAVAYSLAAGYMGMRFLILESGSGAPEPVPLELVSAIRKACSLNISIAGGVKTPGQARALLDAGANCIHIGTCLEKSPNPLARARAFADAIHKKG